MEMTVFVTWVLKIGATPAGIMKAPGAIPDNRE
jgi:hypothetical protein